MALYQQGRDILLPRFKRYSELLEQYMKEEAPKDSGALADSITTESKSQFTYRVGVDSARLTGDARNASKQDYSPWVVEGHGAFTLRPVRAQALRWVGKDGQVHFAKYVNMPATKGNNFPARARKRLPKLTL